MDLARRRLLTGIAALIAAPTIVRAGMLMPVRPLVSIGITLDEFASHFESEFVRMKAALEKQIIANYYADDLTFNRWLMAGAANA